MFLGYSGLMNAFFVVVVVVKYIVIMFNVEGVGYFQSYLKKYLSTAEGGLVMNDRAEKEEKKSQRSERNRPMGGMER